MSAGFDIVLLSVCQNALMWNLSSSAGEQLPHLPLAPSSGLSQPLGWWWWWCNIANWMLLTKKNFLQPSSPPIVSQNCRVLVLPLSLTALELYNEQVRRHLFSLLVLSHVLLSNMGICLLSLIFFYSGGLEGLVVLQHPGLPLELPATPRVSSLSVCVFETRRASMQLFEVDCGGKSQETFQTVPDMSVWERMCLKLDVCPLKQDFQVPQGFLLFLKCSVHSTFAVPSMVS